STDDDNVDRALQGVVGIFETVFSDRIRSYYIEGSYADRTGVYTSDIDIDIVFKEHFSSKDEQKKAERLADQCGFLSAVELDIDVMDEAKITSGISPAFKLGSSLIYGEDIRAQAVILPI